MVRSKFAALTSKYFASKVMTCIAFQSIENPGQVTEGHWWWVMWLQTQSISFNRDTQCGCPSSRCTTNVHCSRPALYAVLSVYRDSSLVQSIINITLYRQTTKNQRQATRTGKTHQSWLPSDQMVVVVVVLVVVAVVNSLIKTLSDAK